VQCVGLLSYFAIPEQNASSKKGEIKQTTFWMNTVICTCSFIRARKGQECFV
jgi:hypothetical protein